MPADLRDTQEFQIFKAAVLKHLEKKKHQTWRELKEKFADAYRLTLAVEELVADNEIRVDKNKPIEKILFGGAESLCSQIGHVLIGKPGHADGSCGRCFKVRKNEVWR